VSVLQPRFSPDGRSLAYVSDESGWGNLYLYDLETETHRQLTDLEAQVGGPAWVQGIRSYGFSPDGKQILFLRSSEGVVQLWAHDLESGQTEEMASPLNAYTAMGQITIAPKTGSLALLASSSEVSARVVSWALDGKHKVCIHKRTSSEQIPAEDLSTPQPVQWAADDGTAAHGLYYPPTSSRFAGRGLPPAVIHIHGGPTGQATAGYNARAQFFATRGYAYLEVNYRGSTGYGKAYMAYLRGQWGVLDVEDALGGARYLSEAGLADGERLVIMGGSAGGYTVLRALTEHPGAFRAALCLYGVSNLFTLAADTHKFEERYLDSLLGPLPKASDLYRERSPIFGADRIVDPVAVFQGEEDRVVPKAQAETIVASLRQRGVPHEYHVYAGEGHGWRKRETIESFWTTVEAFLRQYVIFG
jgi:dipeptidyl aminopeptidase/acylaminoacyl peptidase